MIKLENIFADFQSLDYKVVRSSYNELNGEMFEISENEDDSCESRPNLDFEFDYDVLDIEYAGEDADFPIHKGAISFTVDCLLEKSKDSLFSVEIIGIFLGKSNALSEETFEKMLKLNGITFLSGILRNYILNLTAFTSCKITLPMINVTNLIAEKEATE